MPSSPRTTAIIWTVAFVLDIAAVATFIVSLALNHNHREWFLIILVILVALSGVGAGYNSWRWWRIHKAQTQASIPYYAPPPPAVSAR
ncbi:hypothetical protein C8R44DRAFT_769183 [Mycena epipterygia]|nr:hypothetical protein C8R44DRAFT_769183 [Mycena epipterygia]